MDCYEEILDSLNIPLILSKPIANLHKIFIKYTSLPYYKYAFNLLETLCQKANYENKKRLFHMAFTYLTIILYNCGNIPYLSNFDIMILCCFNLSIKALEKQKNVPCLNKLKKIYKEKFINYQKEEIVKVELICLKLLNYKINLLTAYDCLYYILYKQKNEDLLESATKELENELIYNIKVNISKKPLDLAKEIINNLNNKKNKVKYPKLLKRKIVPMFIQKNINKMKKKAKNDNSEKYKNNDSFVNIKKSNYMSNFSNSKDSPIYSHQNNHSNLGSHVNKLKSNIYNKPISLFLPYPQNNYSSYEKNKIKRDITRNLFLSSTNLINSFNNVDIEYNNSPVNKTNCDSYSPNGSDDVSGFIIHNNSGINLTKNSSSGNIFKKPCLNKNNLKTFFRTEKKKYTSDKINHNLNLSQENLLGDDSPQIITFEKNRKDGFSNTFYFGNTKKLKKQKKKIIKVY